MRKAHGKRSKKEDADALRDTDRLISGAPVPDSVTDEDEIMRMLYQRAEEYRAKPMTDTEISEGQRRLLDHFGDRVSVSSSENETGPFLLMCRRLLDHVTSLDAQAPRAPQKLQTLLQTQSVGLLNAELAQSLLYTSAQTHFAPILYMIQSGQFASSKNALQALIARSAAQKRTRVEIDAKSGSSAVTLKQLVAAVEELAGLGHEGTIVSRDHRRLVAVFEHMDTRRYAMMVLASVCSPALPASPVPTEDGSNGAVRTDYEVFDDSYFKRDASVHAPWGDISVAFEGTFYFDRILMPYERVIGGGAGL